VARPKLDIDPIEVEKLAKLGATNTEIGDFFSCDHTTISGRFSQNLAKGRAGMKLRLRQLQWKSAEAGNVVMQIWLGKNILGQRDSQESDPEQKPDVTKENLANFISGISGAKPSGK